MHLLLKPSMITAVSEDVFMFMNTGHAGPQRCRPGTYIREPVHVLVHSVAKHNVALAPAHAGVLVAAGVILRVDDSVGDLLLLNYLLDP